MDIEQFINKALKQVYLKIRSIVYVSGSGRGSYGRSDITCRKCGKKINIQKDYRSKGNGYSGNSPDKSKNDCP